MVEELERRCMCCGISYPFGDLHLWENGEGCLPILVCRFCLQHKKDFVACLNLATGEEKLIYNTTPEDAVYNLARLESDNADLKIFHGDFSVSCGDWAAIKKKE